MAGGAHSLRSQGGADGGGYGGGGSGGLLCWFPIYLSVHVRSVFGHTARAPLAMFGTEATALSQPACFRQSIPSLPSPSLLRT